MPTPTADTVAATDYDTINADELRWYVVDRANRIISMQKVTSSANRTAYVLTTDWATLRTTLAASGSLTTTTVLEGVLDAAFRFTTFTCLLYTSPSPRDS